MRSLGMVESAITAALVAAVVVLAKVVEYFMKKSSDKKNGHKPVHLHPEVVRQIRETYESIQMLMERDIKTLKSHQEKMAELLGNVATLQATSVRTQEKTVVLLEKVERRLDLEFHRSK